MVPFLLLVLFPAHVLFHHGRKGLRFHRRCRVKWSCQKGILRRHLYWGAGLITKPTFPCTAFLERPGAFAGAFAGTFAGAFAGGAAGEARQK